MAPLLRRSWAPRGVRPHFSQKGRKGEKVSVAAALVLPPSLNHIPLFYKTLVNEYFDNFYSTLFLEALLKSFKGEKMIIIWDRGPIHKGDSLRQLLQIHRHRLYLEELPPYAPKINPVEPVWSWLKYGRLFNYSPYTAEELNERIVAEMDPIVRKENLLKVLWSQSELPIPLTLAF